MVDIPLTQSELSPDHGSRPVAMKLVEPSITLIQWHRDLKILLAQGSLIRRRDRIVLFQARWVTIPWDWRLAWMRFWSRVMPMRLEDEIVYQRVYLRRVAADHYRACLPRCGGRIAETSVFPFPRQHLTEREYRRLIEARGRDLLTEVVTRFARDLARFGATSPSLYLRTPHRA
jgi:hypothetical protein